MESASNKEITLDMLRWWRSQNSKNIPYPTEDNFQRLLKNKEEAILYFCKPQNYLVIGTYEESGERYGDYFKTRTPKEAEEKAKKSSSENLLVAAVVPEGTIILDAYYG